ncbi:hypothetical protein [Streptomyces sp. YIM 130001]|uniref:hypothetical protein n=1 Tax=Streptomyces sp. YIM 130001 TaxID=2259644 RepID=UPI001F090739|nr:hypothetical protein [Streptomyces sp. YIM 130001]
MPPPRPRGRASAGRRPDTDERTPAGRRPAADPSARGLHRATPSSATRTPRGSADSGPNPPPHLPGPRSIVFGRPVVQDDDTAPLRPVRDSRSASRTVAAAACLVLGLGLIGGAATGSWLTGDSAASPTPQGVYDAAGSAWRNEPVDSLFPATLKGDGAGPGGADRRWTRIAVEQADSCTAALDPLLAKTLQQVGCRTLIRATYADATRSHVTTVGMLFTKADTETMAELRTRFAKEGLDRRTDLMPRTLPAKGTAAQDFGARQRASWTVSVLTDAPVVVYAVSGFADGRTVDDPQPAAAALEADATTAPAQSGLGHEAKGIADRVERKLRKTVTGAAEESQ